MDAQTKELLRTMLKKHGYSMTKARLTTCELLWGQEPQSMHELIAKAEHSIDRTSLYRAIDIFEKLGLVERIYIGWKYKIELSDILTHHHHHISCRRCGSIVAIHETDNVERLIASLAETYDFTADSHLLEIRGLCKKCRDVTTVAIDQ